MQLGKTGGSIKKLERSQADYPSTTARQTTRLAAPESAGAGAKHTQTGSLNPKMDVGQIVVSCATRLRAIHPTAKRFA